VIAPHLTDDLTRKNLFECASIFLSHARNGQTLQRLRKELKVTMTKGISIATSIAGIELSTCVYNASGPRTGSAAALAKIAGSSAGAILTKSATLASQTGNPQPRTWHSPDDKASMNSEGLPNSGIDYYIDATTIGETLEGCPEGTNKPYMVSISGKTLDDNLEMLDRISKVQDKIASVELNLACPNVIGKPIIAYDFDQMKMILKTIQSKKYSFILGLKLPPYLDSKHLQEAASIINQYSTMVRYVVCINTIGNALAVDDVSESPFIASNNGLAGLSGPAVKYTALANVRQMRQHLKPEIDIIGVGGKESGTDVFNMLLCGASAVQVGTCHWKEGPKCFDRICDELKEVVSKKGYSDIKSVIGKLKSWSKEGAAKSRAAKKDVDGEMKSGSTYVAK
jgi:dihydroorotate dehydrogenase (fumarate)